MPEFSVSPNIVNMDHDYCLSTHISHQNSVISGKQEFIGN